jgi:hypothetical protein
MSKKMQQAIRVEIQSHQAMIERVEEHPSARIFMSDH